jgi:hypothetical protein
MSAPSPFAPSDSSLVSDLLAKVSRYGKGFEAGEIGAREGIIASSLSLVSALEYPGESIVRIFWAQVSPSFLVKNASDEVPPAAPPRYYSPCNSIEDLRSSFPGLWLPQEQRAACSHVLGGATLRL